MDGIGFWKHCEEISVVQAALLAVSCDPAKNAKVESWEVDERPDGYEALATLIKNAILSDKLKAKRKFLKIRIIYNQYDEPEDFPSDDLDWHATLVNKQDVIDLLASRGFKQGFLFDDAEHKPLYLDASHEFYAPKLHIAIQAWQAIQSNPERLKGRTAKQAITVWLNENAARLRLLKEDGMPNSQAIEEIAKITNWGTKGGAPKTELKLIAQQQEIPKTLPPLEREERPILEGDEIPY